MEALAETLWEAQRGGQPPDERRYLERARARIAAARLIERGTRDTRRVQG